MIMQELKRLLPYIKRYRSRIIPGLIFVTISNICSTVAPRYAGKTIDLLGSGAYSMDSVIYYISIILLLTAGSGLFMYLTRRTIIVSSRLIEYDFRRDFLFAIESQPMSFFHKNPTGSLMALTTNDIPAAREFLGPAIMYSANTITTFSLALCFMISLNPVITAYSLIPLPIIAVATYLLGKKVYASFKDVQETFSDMTTQAQESFSGIRIVRSYTREDYEHEEFSVMARKSMRKNLRLARVQSMIMPVFMVLVGFSNIVVLGFGGMQVIAGKATLGDLTQFFIYLNLLIWPVAAIGWVTNLIQRAAASMGRLGKIFDAMKQNSTDIQNYNDKNSSKVAAHADSSSVRDKNRHYSGNGTIKGTIEFKNVTLKYGEDLPEALSGISFKINSGGSLGIVGPVGCGKSTIANLLPRLFDPSGGSILIDGKSITDYPVKELRSSIGFVPQEPFMFSTTMEENIRFGKFDATQEDILAAAASAQLHSEIETFPDSYKTILGERGITLSGGQKQRLALARAIIGNPSILILDDALSAVDARTEERILTELKQIMLNRTTLIITHRMSAIKDCDMILYIDKGKIAEQGTHKQLLDIKGRYWDTWQKQQLEREIEQL